MIPQILLAVIGKRILTTFLIWAAIKTLVISAITILVPWAIYKGTMQVAEKSMEFAQSFMTGSEYESTFVELTGMAAWLAAKLQFQACFQIMITFVAIRFVLGFIHKK